MRFFDGSARLGGNCINERKPDQQDLGDLLIRN